MLPIVKPYFKSCEAKKNVLQFRNIYMEDGKMGKELQ